MSKKYEIQSKFGKNWITIETSTRQTDALHYVKERSSTRYPLRIVRVVKTVVFEDNNNG